MRVVLGSSNLVCAWLPPSAASSGWRDSQTPRLPPSTTEVRLWSQIEMIKVRCVSVSAFYKCLDAVIKNHKNG